MNAPYHHGNLRQALLDRAIETLSEKGVEHLSLRALARDLGVSHAAPLRHFATKADLLNAIAIEGVGSLVAATDQAAEAASGVKRLRAMALAYVDWAMANAALHQILRNPDVMRHASDDLTKMLTTFAEAQRREIATAQSQGWRPDEHPDVLFLHLVSLTAGTAVVMTGDVYRDPVMTSLAKDRVAASLDLFFG
ncbi:TetR/AcrR family transcriptional regulator [Cognatiyoonia sp. IB215182]|uniref:TetR/AcrR family transcriptional regulator n=1 Tax=Cognatiyoonia sp. IB215182 TaxID=3097353 RepID=UPI002A164C2E|nr:TetR/AcrR family transcriptional regulator [Cognatiyoonia sp. IB215182]MDX8354107.1 TetR/AcrR family transcriptional regulator [Cognatiyoonia sp. IB215182]